MKSSLSSLSSSSFKLLIRPVSSPLLIGFELLVETTDGVLILEEELVSLLLAFDNGLFRDPMKELRRLASGEESILLFCTYFSYLWCQFRFLSFFLCLFSALFLLLLPRPALRDLEKRKEKSVKKRIFWRIFLR